jgi:hypothetical protein
LSQVDKAYTNNMARFIQALSMEQGPFWEANTSLAGQEIIMETEGSLPYSQSSPCLFNSLI